MNILFSIFLIAGVLFLFLFIYSIIKTNNKLSIIFSYFCLFISIYVIGYAFELKAKNIEQIAFFLKFEYFGVPFILPLLLLLIYKMYYNKNPSSKVIILIFTIPLLTLFFSVTNEYHHFLYKQISYFDYKSFIIAKLQKGFWYYINVAYSYLIIIFGIAALIKLWNMSNSIKMKKQIILLILAILIPAISEIVYFCGISPYKIDLTPVGLIFSVLCLYLVLFKYSFLEIDEIIKSIIFNKINEGIIITDGKYRLLEYNLSANMIFDWLKNNIGENLSNIEYADMLIKNKLSEFEIDLEKNNEKRYLEINVSNISDRNKLLGKVYFIRDITKRKEIAKQIEYLANYDSLTNVLNRRRILEELEKEIFLAQRYQRVFSIMMLDIDFFKKVNDIYGHSAGDEVLKCITDICKYRLRRTDIIGRYGGEEFIIILPATKEEEAKKVAENLRKIIQDTEITYEGKIIKITVSIGIATFDVKDEQLNQSQLINYADIALYTAKNNGRNCVYVYNKNKKE